MSEGRERVEWTRLSHLMALIANCNRDPRKTRAFRAGDFDPFVKADKSEDIKIDSLAPLKARFVGS